MILMSLAQNLNGKGVMMSCNRSNNANRSRQVMGAFRIPEIALRGPGCISGTGTCDDVLGTGCGCCCNCVSGTGRSHDNVMGTGENRKCTNDVLGTGGRNRCWNSCEWDCSDLKTPTTVPR